MNNQTLLVVIAAITLLWLLLQNHCNSPSPCKPVIDTFNIGAPMRGRAGKGVLINAKSDENAARERLLWRRAQRGPLIDQGRWGAPAPPPKEEPGFVANRNSPFQDASAMFSGPTLSKGLNVHGIHSSQLGAEAERLAAPSEEEYKERQAADAWAQSTGTHQRGAASVFGPADDAVELVTAYRAAQRAAAQRAEEEEERKWREEESGHGTEPSNM